MNKIKNIINNARNMNATSFKQWSKQSRQTSKTIKQLIVDNLPIVEKTKTDSTIIPMLENAQEKYRENAINIINQL